MNEFHIVSGPVRLTLEHLRTDGRLEIRADGQHWRSGARGDAADASGGLPALTDPPTLPHSPKPDTTLTREQGLNSISTFWPFLVKRELAAGCGNSAYELSAAAMDSAGERKYEFAGNSVSEFSPFGVTDGFDQFLENIMADGEVLGLRKPVARAKEVGGSDVSD